MQIHLTLLKNVESLITRIWTICQWKSNSGQIVIFVQISDNRTLFAMSDYLIHIEIEMMYKNSNFQFQFSISKFSIFQSFSISL